MPHPDFKMNSSISFLKKERNVSYCPIDINIVDRNFLNVWMSDGSIVEKNLELSNWTY